MRDELSRFLSERYGVLYGVALRILGEPHDSEDAVQEAVVSAYQKIDSLRDPAKLDSWLVSIVSNKARRLWSLRSRSVSLETLDEVDEVLATELEESSLIDRRETVTQALASLSDDQADVLLDYYGNGSTTAELAESHETTEATMRSRLSRARNDLVDPVVRRAFDSLGKTYQHEVAPRLQRRVMLKSLSLAHRAGRILVFQTSFGRGLMIRVRAGCGEGSAAPKADSVVIDSTSLFQPSVQIVRGDEVTESSWSTGILGALQGGVPVLATSHYLDTFGGVPRPIETLIGYADSISRTLRDSEAAQDRTREALFTGLADPDVGRVLEAARGLLAVSSAAPVRDALHRRSASSTRDRACRLALLGYVALLEGDGERASREFRGAVALQPNDWEWHLHLAHSLALQQHHADAVVELVRALRADRTDVACHALHWMPHLRPYFNVPRFWHLLKPRPPGPPPLTTYLPLRPGFALCLS